MFTKDGSYVAGAGECSKEMREQGVPPIWNSYVTVKNINESINRAKELGGTIAMPVMKVVEAGFMAFVQDPTGGNLALWQPLHHCGSTLVNEPGSFCWNELMTSDLDAAKSFYSELLGWAVVPFADAPNNYHVGKVNDKDNCGLMEKPEEMKEVPSHWAVYFAVDDVDQTVARAKELNAKICAEPFDTPVGRLAVVMDPEGATFHLAKLKSMD